MFTGRGGAGDRYPRTRPVKKSWSPSSSSSPSLRRGREWSPSPSLRGPAPPRLTKETQGNGGDPRDFEGRKNVEVCGQQCNKRECAYRALKQMLEHHQHPPPPPPPRQHRHSLSPSVGLTTPPSRLGDQHPKEIPMLFCGDSSPWNGGAGDERGGRETVAMIDDECWVAAGFDAFLPSSLRYLLWGGIGRGEERVRGGEFGGGRERVENWGGERAGGGEFCGEGERVGKLGMGRAGRQIERPRVEK